MYRTKISHIKCYLLKRIHLPANGKLILHMCIIEEPSISDTSISLCASCLGQVELMPIILRRLLHLLNGFFVCSTFLYFIEDNLRVASDDNALALLNLSSSLKNIHFQTQQSLLLTRQKDIDTHHTIGHWEKAQNFKFF